ncbi:four helix bundle protein [Aquimarina sp. RZ0]|uniref:four helix bundle protein n=1 Tax=Aquimarina sp. RZ0 TaxID=2607730 RepID=UPI002106E9AA|nr:four helix bundle protein [Aquimarina sp. RZ0]
MKNTQKYDLQNRLVKFSSSIILNVNTLKKNFASEHLTKQLIRSTTSVALNYDEDQGVESKRDVIHKMKICLKELREYQVNLHILKESKRIQDLDNFENNYTRV